MIILQMYHRLVLQKNSGLYVNQNMAKDLNHQKISLDSSVCRKLSKKITDNSAKSLMSGIRKNLRLIGDKGVYEPLKVQNR